MNYKILASGSAGNAVIVEDVILIDCGVSFKALKDYYKDLKLVLLTHIHGDHFNKSTIRRLAYERPTLRFICYEWLVQELLNCGASKRNIDVLKEFEGLHYMDFAIEGFKLKHDVPNCGWKVRFNNGRSYFYATDTCRHRNLQYIDSLFHQKSYRLCFQAVTSLWHR